MYTSDLEAATKAVEATSIAAAQQEQARAAANEQTTIGEEVATETAGPAASE